MSTATTTHDQEAFSLKEWIFTTDHKRIGVMYLIGSMAAFAVAGMMAMMMRLEQSQLGASSLKQEPITTNGSTSTGQQ
jgi:cytochrome c oxidase subunit 1